MSDYKDLLADLEDQLTKERAALKAYQEHVDAQSRVVTRTENAIEVIRERMAAKTGEQSTARKILGAVAEVVAAGATAAIAYEQTRPYRRMTILEAAKAYLAEHGPGRAPDIARALMAGGKANATTNTVRSTLDRARIARNGIEKVGTSWRLAAEPTEAASLPFGSTEPVRLAARSQTAHAS